MATPTPTVSAPASVAPAAMAALGSDSSGTSTHAEGNYFVGFLIAFVVLFLVFALCGIGWRRRLLARRLSLGTLEPWAPITPTGEYRRPVLYEKPIVAGEDDWESMMPLSVHIIHESKETDQKDSSAPPSSPISMSLIPENRNVADVNPPISVPAWIRDSSNSKFPLPEEKPGERELPQALRIAVLINMPCHDDKDSEGASLSKLSIDVDVDRRRRNNRACITTGPIPGFEIGVLHIRMAWNSEISSSRVNLNHNLP